MASCECCWVEADRRAAWSGRGVSAEYYEVMAEHESKGCACADPLSEEGARLRAGQFWDEDRGVDTRAARTDTEEGGTE